LTLINPFHDRHPRFARPDSTPCRVGGAGQQCVDNLALLGQVNALWRGRDAGVNAEADESGRRSLFASPGLSYRASPSVQLYAFAQLPLYRYVNGTQLAVNRAGVAGVTYRI